MLLFLIRSIASCKSTHNSTRNLLTVCNNITQSTCFRCLKVVTVDCGVIMHSETTTVTTTYAATLN